MNADPDSASLAAATFAFADAELDELRRELRVGGHLVALEIKPFELLRVLVRRPGETLSKDELIEAVWPGRVVTEGVLTKCVAKLRAALGDGEQELIRTVHGYGYRLAASVVVRAAAAAATPAPAVGSVLPGRPHWRLVRELGTGGFGSVWLAEHAKTAAQRVFKFAADGAALHALKREITLYRLLQESLGERAPVAHVIDWNIDEPPYFLEEEYIAGGNLAEWCAAQGGAAAVPQELRIELVARLADALAAAHAIGVLHRDLKPANVLVEPVAEGVPGVRLVDFGSGRALEPERLASLGITRLGLTATRGDRDTSGTPFYIAPELIAGGVPTVAADVYALGVILYQLLIGDFRRPLSPGWERDVDDELLREDIAAAADLDPSRRLVGAAELARRLRALAVRAQARDEERAAEAAARRQRELVARWRTHRRWLLAVCGLLAVASVVTVGLYLRAEREAAVAKAVNAFLNEDLLAAANPYRGDGPDLRVREVLDRARDAVGARFAGRAVEEQAVRTMLGQSYVGLGEYAEARRQLQRALELAAASGGMESEAALALRRMLADNEADDSRYDEAEQAYAALAEDLAARHGEDSPPVLDLAAARANVLLRRHREAEAAQAIEALLPRLEARFGAEAEVTLAARTDYGRASQKLARFDAAEAAFRAVYEVRARRFGKQHWSSLQSLQDLAALERDRGRSDAAAVLQREVVAGREAAFGRDHEATQNAVNELAGMLQDGRQLAEAEVLFREVLHVREAKLGERHERTRNSMNNLALVLVLQDKPAEAEALYERARAIERELVGPDDLGVLVLEHNLAGAVRARGDLARAEALSRDVIERAARTLGPERPELGLFLTGLARTLQAQRRYEEGAAAFGRARANLLAAYGPDHPRIVALTRMQLGLYEAWGRPPPADLQ